MGYNKYKRFEIVFQLHVYLKREAGDGLRILINQLKQAFHSFTSPKA